MTMIERNLESSNLKNRLDKDVLLKVQNLKKYFPIKGGILKRTVGHVKSGGWCFFFYIKRRNIRSRW